MNLEVCIMISKMPEYNYYVYSEDGNYTKNSRSKKFTLKELQWLVGGRIEIVPSNVSEKGKSFVYIVLEDGMYIKNRNPLLPCFYGLVLLINEKLIE